MPGHVYKCQNEGLISERYWRLTWPGDRKIPDDYQDVFTQKFKEAVLHRMVPGLNGFETSGGIDSSSIVCTALKYSKEKIAGFSHTLPDEAYGRFRPFKDEKPLIEKIKQRYTTFDSHYIPKAENSIIADIRAYIKYAKDMPQQQIQIMSETLYKEVEKGGSGVLFSPGSARASRIIKDSGCQRFYLVPFSLHWSPFWWLHPLRGSPWAAGGIGSFC